MPTTVEICNQALGMLPADRIQSLAEDSLAAQECAFHYPLAKSYIIKKIPWSWRFTRVQLAPVENDRPNEWGYAYARPTTGQPYRLPLEPNLSAGAFVPNRAIFNDISLAPGIEEARRGFPYLLAGTTIYCNIATALMDVLLDDVDETQIPQLVADAIAGELAGRICLTITKSRERRRELMQEAQGLATRAENEDRQIQPNTYFNHIPDAILARL